MLVHTSLAVASCLITSVNFDGSDTATGIIDVSGAVMSAGLGSPATSLLDIHQSTLLDQTSLLALAVLYC